MHRNRLAFVKDIFQNWPTAWWGEVSCGFQVPYRTNRLNHNFSFLQFLCLNYIWFSHFIMSFIRFLLFFFPLLGTYLLMAQIFSCCSCCYYCLIFLHFCAPYRMVLVFGWAKLLTIFTTTPDFLLT